MNPALAILQGYISGCGNTPPHENPYHGNPELRDRQAVRNLKATEAGKQDAQLSLLPADAVA